MAKYTSEPFGVKLKSDLRRPDKDQFATTYDILSEGPIEGLSNGLASIFVNDVPLIQAQAENILKPRRFKANVTAGNGTITHAQFGEIDALSYQNRTGLSLGIRKVAIEKAGAKGTGIASATIHEKTVTTSSAYFTATMLQQCRQRTVPIYLRIAGAGANGTELRTRITGFTSTTEVTIADVIATTVSSVDIFFDHLCTLTAISGNDATVSGTPVTSVTSANIQVGSPAIHQGLGLSNLFNFKDVDIGFRVGNKLQPLLSPRDSEGTSTLFAPNLQLEQADLRQAIGTSGNLSSATYNDDELDEVDEVEGTSSDTVLTAAAMGVTAPSEVDDIHLTFQLPQCHALKSSSGAKGPSFVELQIFFEYSTDGGTSFVSELAYGPSNSDILTRTNTIKAGKDVNFVLGRGNSNIPNNGYIKPDKAQYTSFIEEFKIDTTQFQPFDTYRIRVRRITALNFKDGSFQHTNPCTLQTVDNIVKDKLSYPYTSYASLSFNAKDFDSKVPTRSYLLKGRKVKVPTNYFTRDETGAAATYKRNVSSGATESTYQAWDGNFRGDDTTFNESSVNYDEVYTDNPVWIFYDILTNKHYGLGQFIDPELIDKYELFRLARFCDEEVPNGEGGTEPRFTCNVYLTKAQEATTVLKQLASVFRGMAIWADGQLTAISDRPKKPVYTFTKANVKDGIFSYEGTGDKVKVNQVKVTWADPDDSYRQAAEYVEDTEALIGDTNSPRLVRTDLLAFGTTSRGQAHRLGKWKLISEQTEKETVSFTSGANVIGLKPGDIVAVQDADRDRASYSGRVSNTGTKNTTTIPLDRDIVIPAYSSSFPPQLLLIYPKGGAYLNQDSATISSVAYSKGDLIPAISSSTAAANLVDDSNNPVDVYWSENARIESKTVSSPGTSGGTVSSLTVSSAFSAVPDAEVMWSLRIFNSDATEATGTVKEYKIVSIKESEEQQYEVVAAEYNINKFDKIERGYSIDPRPNTTFPNPEDEVPSPDNIIVKIIPSEFVDEGGTNGNFFRSHDANITFDFPKNSDGSRYGFVSGFEVTHNFKGKFITERLDTQSQGLTIENVNGGTYEVSIRTISSIETFSLENKRTYTFNELHFTNPSPKGKELSVKKGGLITAPLSFSNGTFNIGAGSGTFDFTGPDGEVQTLSAAATSTMNIANNSGSSDGFSFVLLDLSSNTKTLRQLVEVVDTTSSPSTTYFKINGASNEGLTTLATNTVIDQYSNKITGSNFTNLTAGQLVKVSNGSSTTQATGSAASNTTTITLSGSNSNIKIGQTVTGTITGPAGTGTAAGEISVVNISGTTLTVSAPITVGNGVTLTFTPRSFFTRVTEVFSNTIIFVEDISPRKYSGATLQFADFEPNPLKDAILAKTFSKNGTFTLSENFTEFPVSSSLISFDSSANATFPGTISCNTITATSVNSRLHGVSIGDDSDILLYESSTNTFTIRTGSSGAYKYYTFGSGGDFNILGGGLDIGSTQVITSARNLQNIGTISSGNITTTGSGLAPQLQVIDSDNTTGRLQINHNGSTSGITSVGTSGLGTVEIKGATSGTGSTYCTFNNTGISVSGSVTATGDVIAFSSSDKRLKKNIVKIDSALNKVSQISGYHFEWKDKKEAPHQGKDIGVIAQEIEKVLPEIVSERDTGYKAVNYQKLTALLIEAVKELKGEIDELKKNK